MKFDTAFARSQFPNCVWNLTFFENAGGTFVPKSVISNLGTVPSSIGLLAVACVRVWAWVRVDWLVAGCVARVWMCGWRGLPVWVEGWVWVRWR